MAGEAPCEVLLVIYDLSKGASPPCSGLFRSLGLSSYTMDVVPHTAIVVYGLEYFYRRTICCDYPNQLRRRIGIEPVQILSLGNTKVTRKEFESWCCAVKRGRFSDENYDIMRCNSNHFCRDAVLHGLKLPIGVPEWIFNVPLFFPLSCNIGQFLYPIMYKSSDSCLAARATEESYHNSTIKNISSFVAFMTDNNPSPIQDYASISTSDTCVSSLSNTYFTSGVDDKRYHKSTNRQTGVAPKQPPEIEIVWKDSSEKLNVQGKINLASPSDASAQGRTLVGDPQIASAESREDQSNQHGQSRSLEDGSLSLKIQIRDMSLPANLKAKPDNLEDKTHDAKINMSIVPDTININEIDNVPLINGNVNANESRQSRWRNMKSYIRSKLYDTESLLTDSQSSSSRSTSKNSVGADSQKSREIQSSRDVNKIAGDLSQVDDSSDTHKIDAVKPSQSVKTVTSESNPRYESHENRTHLQCEPNNTAVFQTCTHELKSTSSTTSSKKFKSNYSIQSKALTTKSNAGDSNDAAIQRDANKMENCTNELKSTSSTTSSKKSKSNGSVQSKALTTKSDAGDSNNTTIQRDANKLENSNDCTNDMQNSSNHDVQPGSINCNEEKLNLLTISTKTENLCSTPKASISEEIPEDHSLSKTTNSESGKSSVPTNDAVKVPTSSLQNPVSVDEPVLKPPTFLFESGGGGVTVDVLEETAVQNDDSAISNYPSTDHGNSKVENNNSGIVVDDTVASKDSYTKNADWQYLKKVDDANPAWHEISQERTLSIEYRCTDSFQSPLISDDSKGITRCIQRLQSVLKTLKTVEEKSKKRTLRALDHIKEPLETGATIPISLVRRVCGFLRHCLEHGHSTVHALLLLRIIILRTPPSITSSCYDWLTSELIAPRNETSTWKTMEQPVARSLGWLVACNALPNTGSSDDLRRLIVAANFDMNDTDAPVQLRQAACAFLYNAALLRQHYRVRKKVKVSDSPWASYVSIAIACLNGLQGETDSTARLRRLMILSRILRPKDILSGQVNSNEIARDLFVSFGAKDIFVTVKRKLKASTDAEAATCREALDELIQIMQ